MGDTGKRGLDIRGVEPIRIRPNVKGVKCVQEGMMELGAWWKEPDINRLWFVWEDEDVMATSTHLLILENIPSDCSDMISVGDRGLWCWLAGIHDKIAIDDKEIPEYVADTRIVISPSKFKERAKKGYLEIPSVDLIIVSSLGLWNYRWFEEYAKKKVIVYSLGDLRFLKVRGYNVKKVRTKMGDEFVAWREHGRISG